MTTITASSNSPVTPFVFTPYIEGKSSSSAIGTVYIDQNTGKNLLASLYGPSTNDMSTARLVEILIEEIGKTRENVALMQTLLLKGQNTRVTAKYQENINKLLDAAKAQAEAAKQKEDLEIVKWTLFAVSLVISICSLGAASGITAAIGSVNSIITCLLGVIPYNNKGDSLMDGITLGFQKMNEAIQVAIFKELLADRAKEDGVDLNSMSDEKIIAYAQKLADKAGVDVNYKDASQYSAMTLVLVAQITIAVTIIVVGILAHDGGSSAQGGADIIKSAATNAATSGTKIAADAATTAATTATKAAVQGAADVAKKVTQETTKKVTTAALRSMLQKILERTEVIRLQASKVSKGVQVVEGLAQVGQGVGQIEAAKTQLEASNDQADAAVISAAIKILLKLIEQDEKLLQEILSTQTNTSQVVANILREEHEKNKKVANALTFG